MADTDTGAPPKVVLVAASVLVVALAVAVAVFALTRPDTDGGAADPNGPLPLVAVPAPQADAAGCTTLLAAAPAALTSNGKQLARRPLADPAPRATAAWGADNPVVLRCGLDRPQELTRTAQLRVINGVQWLQVTEDNAATWYVVDRAVYVALTVPDSAGTGPLQLVSDLVSAKLPVSPVKF
ncbi:DUF3515 domain-containing protein [Amycolatopsis ultiminotia]|uniref:DUF3515 domain-containing protein n=1 Tax=Amycolatopsis ultiminotia TaxID=543629 RepID=A0ABP6Y0I1_9PSEU